MVSKTQNTKGALCHPVIARAWVVGTGWLWVCSVSRSRQATEGGPFAWWLTIPHRKEIRASNFDGFFGMVCATKDGQGFGNGNIWIFYNSGSLKAAARELVSQVQCGYSRWDGAMVTLNHPTITEISVEIDIRIWNHFLHGLYTPSRVKSKFKK
jgi:hypothetical protein